MNLRKILLVFILLAYSFVDVFGQFKQDFSFVENVGQILDQDQNRNRDVEYLFRKNDFQVQLRKNGFSYELISENENSKSQIEDKTKKIGSGYKVHRIDINFLNSIDEIKVIGKEKGSVNRYYLGNKEFLRKIMIK